MSHYNSMSKEGERERGDVYAIQLESPVLSVSASREEAKKPKPLYSSSKKKRETVIIS